MIVLVINSGSSSLKFAVIKTEDDSVLCSGVVERIGLDDAIFTYKTKKEGKTQKNRRTFSIKTHGEAISSALSAITAPENGVLENLEAIKAVGHRIVHGGEKIKSSQLWTEEVEGLVDKASFMAPLHNPANILGVKAVRALLPDAQHVGVFDTAFHGTMPKSSYIYGLDYSFYRDHGIRRFGFHGTSHQFVSNRAAVLLQKPVEKLNCITCHLGNGVSLTAIKNGKSVDTSLGFGTMCGVPMGTRAGDVDPAVILHLFDSLKMSASEVKDLLYKNSGMKGLSGLSNDMRDIEEAAEEGNERAKLALEIFARRTAKYIGAYSVHMGGRLDAIVFTAGIGENGPETRESICQGLEIIGAKLDPSKNRGLRGKEAEISTHDSVVKIFVIPTNEELMIAKETEAVVGKQTSA